MFVATQNLQEDLDDLVNEKFNKITQVTRLNEDIAQLESMIEDLQSAINKLREAV
jgi:peptidoglycan hydrolase CwlO-like protein